MVFLPFWRIHGISQEQSRLRAVGFSKRRPRFSDSCRLAGQGSPNIHRVSLRLRTRRTSAKLGPCENYPTLRQAYWQPLSSSLELRQRGSLRRQIHQLIHQRLARRLRRTIPLPHQSLRQLRSPLQNLPRLRPARRRPALRRRLRQSLRVPGQVLRRRSLQRARRRSITLLRLPWCSRLTRTSRATRLE